MIAFSNCDENSLDKVSIGLLKELCNITNAKIVISSTWRMLYKEDEFISIFAKYDWDDFPIIDITPINYGESHRGQEIQLWLNENTIESYIILDDDSDILESQTDRFIHISRINGFRCEDYCKALRLFGRPDDQLENMVNFKGDPNE